MQPAANSWEHYLVLHFQLVFKNGEEVAILSVYLRGGKFLQKNPKPMWPPYEGSQRNQWFSIQRKLLVTTDWDSTLIIFYHIYKTFYSTHNHKQILNRNHGFEWGISILCSITKIMPTCHNLAFYDVYFPNQPSVKCSLSPSGKVLTLSVGVNGFKPRQFNIDLFSLIWSVNWMF